MNAAIMLVRYLDKSLSKRDTKRLKEPSLKRFKLTRAKNKTTNITIRMKNLSY